MPAIERNNVVFPHPEGPKSVIKRPAGISRLSPFKTWVCPKFLNRLRTDMEQSMTDPFSCQQRRLTAAAIHYRLDYLRNTFAMK